MNAKEATEAQEAAFRNLLAIHAGDKSKIYTGVYSLHDFEHIHEEAETGIDLSWEEAVRDYMAEHQYTREAAVLAVADMEMESDTWLIGFKHDDDSDKFVEDQEADYSAIVRYSSQVVQVTRSKWVAHGAPCSPCYPGQIDGDSPGGYTCYAPDPELIGNDGDQDLAARIHELERYDRTVRIDQIVIMWDFDESADIRGMEGYTEERIDGFMRGDWSFYSCRATGWLSYQCSKDGSRRLEDLSSGGLYGIDLADDPDHEEYKRIEKEEVEELRDHLSAFGVDLSNFDEKAGTAKRVTP